MSFLLYNYVIHDAVSGARLYLWLRLLSGENGSLAKSSGFLSEGYNCGAVQFDRLRSISIVHWGVQSGEETQGEKGTRGNPQVAM